MLPHQDVSDLFFGDGLAALVLQLNALYEFDCDQMGEARHDYGKTYDATGRASPSRTGTTSTARASRRCRRCWITCRSSATPNGSLNLQQRSA